MSSGHRTKIVAAIGAMTAAIRAQRALQAANLYAEVVALLPTETKKGCAYGVEFWERDESAARAVFRQARIRVSQFLKKEAPP